MGAETANMRSRDRLDEIAGSRQIWGRERVALHTRRTAGVLFGAAYYHEYQPDRPIHVDLDLMAGASFTVIRVGESVWSTWEPEDGRFELEWLRPILNAAAERGMSVILGTPTYAVPPWLARKFPEIAGERRSGERIPWGARQEVDFTHPAFRFHAERIIRSIVATYRDHPSVIGFQVDNEPGLELLHNRGVFELFVDHLRVAYGTVGALNERWGLAYWSHRLSDWRDLWTPDGNLQPQYDLAWRRFQAMITAEFIGWQARIVRGLCREDQFVTSCIALERLAVDDRALGEMLDITAGNVYYDMQHGLEVGTGIDQEQGWRTVGAWALYRTADQLFGSRGANFLITETNAGAIGKSWHHLPGYDGQWRQVAWALVARGASMIEYWQWHTLPFGAETHWVGVLPHDLAPGRVYKEIAEVGRELGTARSLLPVTPDADVGIVYSYASKWALAAQPALSNRRGGGDQDSYRRILDAFYQGAFEAGGQVRFIHDAQLDGSVGRLDPGELAAALPVLIAPALYVASDDTLKWLREYARLGGHLVLGVRSGYADTDARARRERKPALLDEAAGIWYQESSTPSTPIPVRSVAGGPLADGAQGWGWIDHLVPQGASSVAVYEDAFFGQWPAVVTHEYGDGRITTFGSVPNAALARSIFRRILPKACWGGGVEGASVTVTSAVGADDTRLLFVHNWSWTDAEICLGLAVTDVLEGTALGGREVIRLRGWDVRVLRVDPEPDGDPIGASLPCKELVKEGQV